MNNNHLKKVIIPRQVGPKLTLYSQQGYRSWHGWRPGAEFGGRRKFSPSPHLKFWGDRPQPPPMSLPMEAGHHLIDVLPETYLGGFPDSTPSEMDPLRLKYLRMHKNTPK